VAPVIDVTAGAAAAAPNEANWVPLDGITTATNEANSATAGAGAVATNEANSGTPGAVLLAPNEAKPAQAPTAGVEANVLQATRVTASKESSIRVAPASAVQSEPTATGFTRLPQRRTNPFAPRRALQNVTNVRNRKVTYFAAAAGGGAAGFVAGGLGGLPL
jgi:hypothetical protein